MLLGFYSIRLLLVFGILLSGVPAWQHSHDAGNRPHSHVHEHATEHDHDGLGESHPHLHVTLFGVEFTIPVESGDDDSRQGESTFLVAVPIAVDFGSTASHFAALAQPTLDLGEPAQIVPNFRCLAAMAAPLSDNAHHQRSGVLLI